MLRRGGDVHGKASFQPVATQTGAATGREQRSVWLARVLDQPGAQQRGSRGGQWGDPLLAAFAELCRSVGNAESRLPLTALLLLCLLCAI